MQRELQSGHRAGRTWDHSIRTHTPETHWSCFVLLHSPPCPGWPVGKRGPHSGSHPALFLASSQPPGAAGPRARAEAADTTIQFQPQLGPSGGWGRGGWRGQGASAVRGRTVITQGLGFLPQTQTCRNLHIKRCAAICADIQRSRPWPKAYEYCLCVAITGDPHPGVTAGEQAVPRHI